MHRLRHIRLSHLHVPRGAALRGVHPEGRRPGGNGVTAVLATAAIAPVLATGSVRAEQVTQLVLGESAVQTDEAGEWLRIRTMLDDYEGWVHRGYVRVVDDAAADAWRTRAGAWSEGARVAVGEDSVHMPLRTQVQLDREHVTLPDGRSGRLIEGTITARDLAVTRASGMPPAQWALDHFRGAPYQWGGLTPWGVDCSGLVQTTFLARGVTVPRDSSAQARWGDEVAIDGAEPGDLLFFRSESGSGAITHVAFAAPGNFIVHSTIACGGVIHEPFGQGTRAGHAIGPRLVAVRRFARS
ncbi:MAG: C40 family peptidase [Gemmatimonadota bacterium]